MTPALTEPFRLYLLKAANSAVLRDDRAGWEAINAAHTEFLKLYRIKR